MPPLPRAPSRLLLQHLHSLAFSPTTTPSSQSARLSHPTHRHFTTTRNPSSPPKTRNPYAPKTHDRGPQSTEDTQTDFSKMDIFNTSATPTPATSIDACTGDGFHLNNGVKTTGGKGVLLVGGECFLLDFWRSAPPSKSSSPSAPSSSSSSKSPLLSSRGNLELPPSSLTLLSLLHPKPDLLLLGTGAKLHMLAKSTRDYLAAELGLRVDVMDTANASAAYNLLAQERGVEGGGGVGAVLLPLGWTGRGA